MLLNVNNLFNTVLNVNEFIPQNPYIIQIKWIF